MRMPGMRIGLAVLLAAGFSGITVRQASAQEPAREAREDIRADKAQLSQDARTIHADRLALKEAKRSGDKARIAQAREQLRKDMQKRKADRKDLKKDEAEKHHHAAK